MQHANGVLSNSEFNVLTELYKASRKAIAVTSNLVIWIDTPVEKCYANVENRNRQGEGGISKEYLAEVDKYHRSWLEGNDAVKVIRIDGNVSLYELRDKAEKLAHIVLEEL